MENRFRFNKIFRAVFTTSCRYIDIWGGRAGGRSFFGTEYFLFLITQPQYFRGCFLRNVAADIRESLFQDFKDRIDESNFEEEDFEINESKMSITYKLTGNSIISKGFKKSSYNRSAKLKSLAGLTHVLIEEADENTEADVNKLDDSIRTDKIENIQIIFLHNAPSKNHWITKRFYNLNLTGILDKQGNPIPYYRATPKQNPDVLSIFSTYKNNEKNLNEKTIRKYEEYGREGSPFYNPEHYYVDVCGFIPEGARGRIYPGWFHITKALWDELPFPVYYGLDFGYSNDPVALVAIKSHNNRNFYHELIYETELTNPMLYKRMRALGVPLDAEIFADEHEPKSIQELNDLGYKKMKAAAGGPGSINFGINVLKGMENFVTEESKNLWYENEEYKWMMDADGEPTDKPMDKNNHLKDASRYGVTGKKALKRKGKVTISRTAQEGLEEDKKSLLDKL